MRPNVLLVRLDGAQSFPFFSDFLIKPNVGKIRSAGVSFRNAYSVSTISHPSQRSIDTGVFPHKHKVLGNIIGTGCYELKTPPEITTLGAILKENGYLTGKAAQGSGNDDDFYRDLSIPYPRYAAILEKKGYKEETIPGKSYKYCGRLPYGIEHTRDAVYTKKAVELIELFSREKEPWFIHCAFDGPHPPCKIPGPFDEMYNPEDINLPLSWNDNLDKKPYLYRLYKQRANGEGDLNKEELKVFLSHSYGFLTMLDELFGWLIGRLEELKIFSKTLVIFTSDHGGSCGAHKIIYHGCPLMEETTKVPLFLCWSNGLPKGKTLDDFVGTVDILPTVLDVCGIKRPSYLDGKSLIPLINGKLNECRKNIFTEWTSDGKVFLTMRAVRDTEYKFIYTPFTEWELYNLNADPFEMNNLINDANHKKVIKKMGKIMLEWMRETDDPALETAERDLNEVQ